MSSNIIRVASGVIGLVIAALPQMAAAQTYYDAPPAYHPSIREGYLPANDGWGYEPRHVESPRFDERRAQYDDEEYRPRRRIPRPVDNDVYGEGYGAYGHPDTGSRHDRPLGLPIEDGYRPAAVLVPVYGRPRPVGPNLGCTVQRSVQDTGAGVRETMTRSCYSR